MSEDQQRATRKAQFREEMVAEFKATGIDRESAEVAADAAIEGMDRWIGDNPPEPETIRIEMDDTPTAREAAERIAALTARIDQAKAEEARNFGRWEYDGVHSWTINGPGSRGVTLHPNGEIWNNIDGPPELTPDDYEAAARILRSQT